MLNGGEIRKLLGTNSIHGSIFREKEIYINWKPSPKKKLKWKKFKSHKPLFRNENKDNKEIQTEGEEMNISVGFMMFHF